MTKKSFLFIIAVSLFIFQSYAVAAGVETFKITKIGVDLAQQTFFVGITPDSVTSSCGRKEELKWSLSSAGVNTLISTALSAHATGKSIVVGVTDTCVVGQATGSFLYIAN